MKTDGMTVHEHKDGSFRITDRLGNERARVRDGKMAAIHLGMALDELDALKAERDRLADKLEEVIDLIDDVLYNPHVKPRDQLGRPITGNAVYLTDLPIMEEHLPSLRQWFVKQLEEREAAEAAKAKGAADEP